MKKKGGKEVQTDITCMRKFTAMDESLKHLVDHHLVKMRDESLPLECCWENCSEKFKLYPSLDELKDHMQVHVQEKAIKVNSLATTQSEDSQGTSESESSVVTSTVSSPAKSKGDQATGNAATTEDTVKNKNNWMDSVLLSLSTTSISCNHISCDASISCCFCMFISWKKRLLQNELELFSLPHEFEDFKSSATKFKLPQTYLDHLLKCIARDELANHATSTFKDTYLLDSVKQINLSRCRNHKIKKDLGELVPTDCNFCTKSITAWHKKSHKNLILKLDSRRIGILYYPEFLEICQQKYKLVAAVAQGALGYKLYRFINNAWVTNCSTTAAADASEVLNNRQAVFVVYTLEESHLEDPEDSSYNNYEKKEIKYLVEKREPNDGNQDLTQTELCQKYAADTTTNVSEQIPLSIVKIKHQQPEEDVDIKMNVCEAFTYRTMTSEYPNSCLLAVLNVIFQTSLTTSCLSLGNHCFCSSGCMYCTVCIMIRRLLENTERFNINANPLYKSGDLSKLKNEPSVLMHHLIKKIIEHEINYHQSYSTKYKFMVQMKKKTCSCMISSEECLLTLEPVKKHEDLLCLLENMEQVCVTCGTLTTVQPIGMPDNLLINIKPAKNHPEACVHFPDEWASSNGRYILYAVIVREYFSQNPSEFKYVCYSKVFEKWVRYDGNVITAARSSDALGIENACLLLYVKNEITSEMFTNFGLNKSFSAVDGP